MEPTADKSYQQVVTHELTPGQHWTRWSTALFKAMLISIGFLFALWIYLRIRYGYWYMPDEYIWLQMGKEEEDWHQAIDLFKIVAVLGLIAVLFAIAGGIVGYRGYRMRQEEIAAEKVQIRTDLYDQRQWNAYYAEVVAGYGPLAMERHQLTLKTESANLSKILRNELQLKEIEASKLQGAAAQRVQDEMTLMRGMVNQIKELNKIKALDPIFGQQVWGEWQRRNGSNSNRSHDI